LNFIGPGAPAASVSQRPILLLNFTAHWLAGGGGRSDHLIASMLNKSPTLAARAACDHQLRAVEWARQSSPGCLKLIELVTVKYEN